MIVQSAILVRAVGSGNVERVRTLLLRKRRDLNLLDLRGRTLLLWAVQEEDSDMTRLLLEHGADPNQADTEGQTPLSQAAAINCFDIMESLLEFGADVNQNAINGTALHFACAYENQEIVEFLLSKGADVHATDKQGWTPLFYSADHADTATIRLLLKHKARSDIRDYEGKTPRDIAQDQLKERIERWQEAISALM